MSASAAPVSPFRGYRFPKLLCQAARGMAVGVVVALRCSVNREPTKDLVGDSASEDAEGLCLRVARTQAPLDIVPT